MRSRGVTRITAVPEELARVLLRSRNGAARRRAARAAAERLADPRTVVIITGQQAGLFGGPLFTLLKALTAMKLAEQVAREHGVPVVPVFWIDAEDHDWPEVSGCTVLDARVRAAHDHACAISPGAGHLPIARLDARRADRRGDRGAAVDAARHRIHAPT